MAHVKVRMEAEELRQQRVQQEREEEEQLAAAAMLPTIPEALEEAPKTTPAAFAKRMSQGALKLAQEIPSISELLGEDASHEEAAFDWFEESPEDYQDADDVKLAAAEAPCNGPNRLRERGLAFALLGCLLFAGAFAAFGSAGFMVLIFTAGHVVTANIRVPPNSITAYLTAARFALTNLLCAVICLQVWWPSRFLICWTLFCAVHAVQALVWQFLSVQLNEKAFKERLLMDRFRMYILEHLRLSRRAQGARPSGDSSHDEGRASTASLLFRPASYGDGAEGDDSLVKDILQYADGEPEREIMPSQTAGDFALFKRVLRRRLSMAVYERERPSLGRNVQWKQEAKELFEMYSLDRMSLTKEDLSVAFSSASALADAYAIFDADRHDRLTRRQFRDAYLRIHSQHANLIRNIRDTMSVFDMVSMIVLGILSVAVGFVSLWVYDLNVYVIISLVVSIILSLNMTISEPLKNVLLSVIFLFVYQVFSIGDEVIIPGILPSSHEERLTVRRIHLTLTTFTKSNGAKVYYENFKLYQSTIMNLSRTKQTWERIEFDLKERADDDKKGGESRESIARQCIRMFALQNPSLFYPLFSLRVRLNSDFNKSDAVQRCEDKRSLLIPYVLMIRCKADAPVNLRHTRLLVMLKDLLDRLNQ